MALYYDLPVYRDTYRLILKIFECTKDFPKEYKYTLGQELYISLKCLPYVYPLKNKVPQIYDLQDFTIVFSDPSGTRTLDLLIKSQ